MSFVEAFIVMGLSIAILYAIGRGIIFFLNLNGCRNHKPHLGDWY
jgi:hypothetical protein